MTADIEVPQTTLRDTLAENFDAAEAGTLPTPEERVRDEAGRFAQKEAAKIAEPPVETPETPLPRPTTWKKDYLPLWDKMATNQVLTPEESRKFLEYANQRETEYKTGVSTYRAEAQQAREVQEAITPFLSELQAHGTTPSAWIKDVGAAHLMLTRGTPEQKVQLIQQLAQRYGVPMAAIQQQPGQMNPVLSQLMQVIGNLNNQQTALNSKYMTLEQRENEKQYQQMQGEVEKMYADPKYPHMQDEDVRERMAQLLETQATRDLPMAYKTAVRERDDLFDAELDRRMAEKSSVASSTVSKARAKAISPKSATPSGQVTTAGAKDRRSILEEGFDSVEGGRV